MSTISDERLAEMIIAAYRRGHAWCLENPGSEEYLAKAAYDYADKALSSLEASPAPVSGEMVEVVAHAISRLIPLDGGSKWLEPYGHDFPKDYSPNEQFMIRQIAAAALAAKGGQ